ncbi:HlyD family type I secretion periplasmic adaptor subunit [Magnetococcales bacterium HHB-1]
MRKSKRSFLARHTWHLSKSILLEETGAPLLIRAVIIFSTVLMCAFLFWAMRMPLDEVAVATGVVVLEGEVKSVDHAEGGVIQDILVKNGDRVAKGQLLLRLKPEVSSARLEESRLKKMALIAEMERLEALLKDQELSADESRFRHDQKHLLALERYALQTEKKILDKQILQEQEKIEALKRLAIALKGQRMLLNEEVGIRKKLVNKGYNSKTLLLGFRRERSRLSGELEQMPARKREALARIAELEARKIHLEQRFFNTVQRNLIQVRQDLAATEVKLQRDQEQNARLALRAPVSGLVHRLKKHTIGGVVQPGEVVMDIVPESAPLKAKIRIDSKDVGHLKVGQEVLVKLITYDYARYGGVRGRLERISANALPGAAEGIFYFTGMVSLEKNWLGRARGQFPIAPGMTVNADILTGKKTVMAYLLKPIFASAKVALRER